MEIFIKKPDISMLTGITVTKDTKFEYKNENVEQKVENLIFHSVTRIKGDTYESVCDTTISLNEGDVLLFEEEARGYIKPVESFVKISEAIEDLENIKDIGERHDTDGNEKEGTAADRGN